MIGVIVFIISLAIMFVVTQSFKKSVPAVVSTGSRLTMKASTKSNSLPISTSEYCQVIGKSDSITSACRVCR